MAWLLVVWDEAVGRQATCVSAMYPVQIRVQLDFTIASWDLNVFLLTGKVVVDIRTATQSWK